MERFFKYLNSFPIPLWLAMMFCAETPAHRTASPLQLNLRPGCIALRGQPDHWRQARGQ